MAQTKKKPAGKKKPVRTAKRVAQKRTPRRPVKPKTPPKRRVTSKTLPRTRPMLKDKSLDAVSMQLQRMEKQVASLQAERTESPKGKPIDVEAKLKGMDRKLDSRLGRLEERLDSVRAHLLDLEERLEGETNGGSLQGRDLDEGLDDS